MNTQTTLKSVPGFALVKLKPGFTPALKTAAKMFGSTLKPVTRLDPNGNEVQLYIMRGSVFMIALAMQAVDLDRPLFLMHEHTHPEGREGWYVKLEQAPSLPQRTARYETPVRFTSIGARPGVEPVYVDEEGTAFRVEVL